MKNMLNVGRAAVAAALLAAAVAACADGPATGPDAAPRLAPQDAPSLGVVGRVSQRRSGDTTITVFTLAPGRVPTPIHLGNDNKIDIPDGASSICDIAASSYGPGTWDAPCTPSTSNVTITARTWLDARGLAHSEFQPALRFVPDDARPVVLYMRNKQGLVTPGMRIDYCTRSKCVDEALADPSVATRIESKSGQASRRIKHFSGYTVTAD